MRRGSVNVVKTAPLPSKGGSEREHGVKKVSSTLKESGLQGEEGGQAQGSSLWGVGKE